MVLVVVAAARVKYEGGRPLWGEAWTLSLDALSVRTSRGLGGSHLHARSHGDLTLALAEDAVDEVSWRGLDAGLVLAMRTVASSHDDRRVVMSRAAILLLRPLNG